MIYSNILSVEFMDTIVNQWKELLSVMLQLYRLRHTGRLQQDGNVKCEKINPTFSHSCWCWSESNSCLPSQMLLGNPCWAEQTNPCTQIGKTMLVSGSEGRIYKTTMWPQAFVHFNDMIITTNSTKMFNTCKIYETIIFYAFEYVNVRWR